MYTKVTKLSLNDIIIALCSHFTDYERCEFTRACTILREYLESLHNEKYYAYHIHVYIYTFTYPYMLIKRLLLWLTNSKSLHISIAESFILVMLHCHFCFLPLKWEKENFSNTAFSDFLKINSILKIMFHNWQNYSIL